MQLARPANDFPMAKTEETGKKRRNRAIGLAEALGATLDPVLKKRGFASRSLIDHWQAIAPEPYGGLTRPDRLHWSRGEAGAEGAVLYLRVVAGHAHAIQHDGPAIARAVNRYFGYVLVQTVKLSAEPFSPGSGAVAKTVETVPDAIVREVEMAVDEVADDGVREALEKLGRAIMTPKGG